MKSNRTRARVRIGAAAAAALFLSTGASGEPDSCREWKAEHTQWMTETVRLYLNGAPQGQLDAALFELLQREAYLTSCDVAVGSARKELVGWRLVGRNPDEYGSAVLETVLDCAGFDPGLRPLFAAAPPALVAERRAPPPRYGRGRRGAR